MPCDRYVQYYISNYRDRVTYPITHGDLTKQKNGVIKLEQYFILICMVIFCENNGVAECEQSALFRMQKKYWIASNQIER